MAPYNQTYSWDKGIHLLAHGMILFRYLIWGKGGNVSVFSTECYKNMITSNVTGWPVSRNWQCPDSGDKKVVLSAQRRRNQRAHTSKIKKLFLSPPWAITRRANLASTWRQLEKLTREVEGLLQDFIRDTVFGHSGQLPYSCKNLCTLPVCYIVR